MTVTTTNNGIPLQGLGDSLNSWGIDSSNGLNNALSLLEKLCSGVETVSLTGNVTLTTTAKADNQARNIGFILTDGGLSSAPTVTVPSIEGLYIVYNAGSTYAVTLTCSGSATTASCAAGLLTVVLSDGTDCFAATPRLDQISAPTSSVSMNSQKITSLATGTASTDAVNLSQMNTAIASAAVPASTGAVLVSANDTTAQYLNGALVAGANVTLTENNDGGDETLSVAVSALDNAIVGGSTPAAGTFTDLTANSSFTSPGIDDNADTVFVTLTSGEQMLLGHTSALSVGGTGGRLQVAGASGANSSAILAKFADASDNPEIRFLSSRASSQGGNGILSAFDATAAIRVFGDDGAAYREHAKIVFRVDGTPASGDMPGSIAFETAADGGTTLSQWLLIQQSGSIRHSPSSREVIAPASHLTLRAYTVSTLPAATAWHIIFVSDGTSSKRFAVADGSNWLFPDGNVVS